MPECTECGVVLTSKEELREHMLQFHRYERTKETL